MSLKADSVSIVYRGSGFFSSPLNKVLNKVSIELHPGETYGLMGSSGSGKSTLARVIAGLERPREGRVLYAGKSLPDMDRVEYQTYRRDVQVLFQDPTAAMNPKKKVEQSMRDVLRLMKVPKMKHSGLILDALDHVGVTDDVIERTPMQLSGGQNQRIALARILLLNPEYIILDEPTSALDVSVQSQVLRLLQDIQDERGTGYLFISHDSAVVDFMADRKGVLIDGSLSEGEDR
ncbi:ABC transporter ATP-binding protein [Methanocalculus sp.]|uniref:ABC transporter ATP-binding protein n=1 Tax=Methanocalculus sp. TaxID=2004547 RepID=UPI00271A9E04|nr:ATP-binding cassette domain-containing protein [Methanocalculus sp.]MDO8841146.1 ATP-binding cassette domain-containing protein [Methanocalculus sp.]